jgi:ABC-2 type transport system permease protein
VSATAAAAPRPRTGVGKVVADSRVIAWRNLKRVPRIPELAIFAIFQSIMFVVLFAFVFGGAIVLPGYSDSNAYRQYLLPGVFVQTISFAAATTAVGMTDDANKGIIDRFRSLPMATSAVLAGRTVSDVVYNGGILIVLMLSGLLVGWSVESNVAGFIGGVVLLLAFAFAMSWVGVWLGLSVPTVEVAQQFAFIVIFPLSFVSSAFVPIATMPAFLQPFAEWNPISSITSACRQLFGNPNPFVKSGSFPSEHPIEMSIIWIVILVAVFAPLGVRRYRSMDR